MEKHFSKVIGDKRRGSLPAKLCLAKFCKDLPITNGFSLTLFFLYGNNHKDNKVCPNFFRSVLTQYISDLSLGLLCIFYQTPQFFTTVTNSPMLKYLLTAKRNLTRDRFSWTYLLFYIFTYTRCFGFTPLLHQFAL